ncbi:MULTISPECIES: cyclic lactone autoinducer peptide [Paenibacillus]|uniref:Cyclic lactone autoinducer peptide n=1 Tax=Paenibacillus tianjinensis TaxID=2810347 RepID=A0ABX7L8C2_9BACL|nr:MULTISPECIES: cyclic lactone autoinducer peptide [Paenibacillus]QSF43601.1 cyclic lactone autoinducer peptide [Paenibacillus tianjinensis]
MKSFIAKQTSSMLEASARFFATVMKIGLHSPEAPKELRK